eukprot:CAMPEP_0203849198 /NCGR_PEP_ID=MMETSP0359-20131031/6043_1 /ASSEMBLY_ACC=CAM_ASM_000338 /TAXON_ID=268821 /ORGANISM="Scrippsiella Hangoei, Strain SHTV-5" /LENGTH=35 /DNA_ID= /DNA_START= /DNA_END= /DNA_ORIENTATION=
MVSVTTDVASSNRAPRRILDVPPSALVAPSAPASV